MSNDAKSLWSATNFAALMRLAILPLIFAQTNSIGEYVENNYNTIVREENLIGTGCASKVYGFKLGDKNLVLKEYHDVKRCKREVAFLGVVSSLELPAPMVHYRSVSRSIAVMDRLGETLRRHLQKDIGNEDVLRRLVNELLDAVTMMHEKEIVHGDIHLDNIMVDGGRVFFIDFDESFISTDFTLDIIRLNHYVLSKIKDWEMLVDTEKLRNPESFEIMKKICHDPRISLVFRITTFFNEPGVQYWVYKVLGIPTSLRSLIGEYSDKIMKRRIK